MVSLKFLLFTAVLICGAIAAPTPAAPATEYVSSIEFQMISLSFCILFDVF